MPRHAWLSVKDLDAPVLTAIEANFANGPLQDLLTAIPLSSIDPIVPKLLRGTESWPNMWLRVCSWFHIYILGFYAWFEQFTIHY